MLTIGAPFSAVTATLQATGTRYLLAGSMAAATTGPVASLQRGGAFLLFWIRVSPFPHHTRFQTLLPIRSTFRAPETSPVPVPTTTLVSIRTLPFSIFRPSRHHFH